MLRRAKGLDDLSLIGGQPRLRRFHHVPREVSERRPVYPVATLGAIARGGSLAQVRSSVTAAVTNFIGARDCSTGRALLVSAAPGSGKSTATANAIREHKVEARVVVGTKALARELAATHDYHLIVGRNRANCERFDVVKALGDSGHRVEPLACGTPLGPCCPYYADCKYLAQFFHSGPRVAATEQLFNRTFLEGGLLAVVDDAELQRALVERWLVSSKVLERAAHQVTDAAVLNLLPVLQHAIIDAPTDTLTGAHVWDRFVATAARYGKDFVALVDALPERNALPEPGEDADGYVSVRSVEAVPPATLALVFDALKRERAAFLAGDDFNSQLELSRAGIRVGRLRQHAVDAKGHVLVGGMGLLVLDATPLHVLGDRITALHERLPDVDGDIELPPNVTVVQYASSTNGHSALQGEERLQRVLTEIEEERRRVPAVAPADEALITYRQALPAFAAAGFADGQLLSFGSVRGSNAVEQVRRLHLVGRPMTPTDETHYLAQIIHHDECWVSPELAIVSRHFGGQPLAVDVVDYADPRIAALLRAQRENEMVQVIHRARPFILDAQRRLDAGGTREALTLVIHSSHPIPGLRVDRLVDFERRERDVNTERSLDAAVRVEAAVARLRARGRPSSVEAVAREAGASWRTVRRLLGTTLHTPVAACSTTSEEADLGTSLHTPKGVEPDAQPPSHTRSAPSEAASDRLGTTLHTLLIDLLTRVQSCPHISERPYGRRPHWQECPGGCESLMPPGQKCLDCSAAAVERWKQFPEPKDHQERCRMTHVALRQVRCPHCNRLAAEAAPGSRLRVKCVRCGRMFERAL